MLHIYELQASGENSSHTLQLPAASGKVMRLRYGYFSSSGNATCEIVASLLGDYVMISAKLPEGKPHSLRLDGEILEYWAGAFVLKFECANILPNFAEVTGQKPNICPRECGCSKKRLSI